MKRKRGNLKAVSGTAQAQRFPSALAPESAPVDERTCSDLMSFASEFAKLVNYHDESNQLAGNWSTFFESDLSFLLAHIASIDLRREHFYTGSLQKEAQDGHENTKEILREIWRMVKRIDMWYRQASTVSQNDLADNSLRLTLQSIISTDLNQYLGENIDDILKNLPRSPEVETWSSYWKRRESQLDAVWRETPEDTPYFSPLDYPTPLDGLLGILHGMHDANHKLQQVARQYLDEMLTHRSDHPPHAALFIAFAKLLDLLRGKINRVTERHLDFYYRNVLRMAERGSTPDIAHLSFELAPQINGYMLPAGTRLTAGKEPNGSARTYTTDADLFINRARIDAVKTVYVSRDLFATSSHAPQRTMNIRALPKSDCEDGLAAPLLNPDLGWPTFGVNELIADSFDRAHMHAELGVILASPVLLLLEGERNVTVSIAFSGENSFETALENYQKVAAEILDQPPSVELLLADAFLVYVSAEKGWMHIAQASYRRHPVVGTTMEIAFTLSPSDPAIAANPELSPEPAQSQWPMLRLVLNPLARIFAYSFFKDLAVEMVDIQVSVQGLKKTLLRNEAGLLSSAQPFPVFGPVPVQGSYLLVSHPELAVKLINHATISVTWLNLPKPPSDMDSYYAAYNLGITDGSFKVRLSVFGTETWVAYAADNQYFPLFTRDFDQSGLLPSSVLSLDMPQLPAPIVDLATALQVAPEQLTESHAPRGAIRLELAEPSIGFGQSVFPGIMTEAATANARAGKNGTHTPLPNPPLIPMARSLVLDYEASDRLVLNRPLPKDKTASFYCLDPFGYTGHPGRPPKMLPQFSEQGHLYFGISGTGPQQSLTVLFQIRDAAFSPVPSIRNHRDQPTIPIRWRYLSGNDWKYFPNRLVLSDSTMGLTRSGIVQFSMPEDITSASTLMPAGLCWIEAVAENVAGVYWCNIVSIATQAVTATRICNPQNELVPAVLPPGSITELLDKKPQIKTIAQPFATSDGRSKETVTEFQTRVSERLRHKGRAIQMFDYERLILDEFPEVGQIKVIGNNNSRYFPGTIPIKPGMLYIVATPRLQNNNDREPRLPQFVLKRIENFIRPYTSAFVEDIHVINPVYETLKIFAVVEFSGRGDAAYYSDDLDAAISRYLQPWRQSPPEPMYIGRGQLQSYQLGRFIQQQPYVKQLQKMVMLHTYRTDQGYVSEWRSLEQRAWASAPWAVLIPAARHKIVSVGRQAQEIDEGIRSLMVGSDFVMRGLGPDKKKEKSSEPRYFLVIPRSTVQGPVRE